MIPLLASAYCKSKKKCKLPVMQDNLPLKAPPTSKGVSAPSRKLATWVPAALLGGGLLGLLVAHSTIFYLGLTALGAALLVLRLLRRGGLSSRAQDAGLRDLMTQRYEELAEIRRTINRLQFLENVGVYGQKSADLLASAQERWKNFQNILPQKFSPTEITFQRYFTQAEQAYMGIVHELSTVGAVLRAISGIDEKELQRQISGLLEGDPARQNLNDRLTLRRTKLVDVAHSFELLESGLSQFDRLLVSLAELSTSAGANSADLESTFGQLQVLADRAKKYQKVATGEE